MSRVIFCSVRLTEDQTLAGRCAAQPVLKSAVYETDNNGKAKEIWPFAADAPCIAFAATD